MKRILHLILISCLCLSAAAQKNAPKWMNKAKRAVFTITTYGKDGNKLATSTGFFISETGEAVSAYNIFKGAEKATITDFEGKTFLVKNILGADELYDAVKFQVEVPKKAVSCRLLLSRWQTGRMPICYYTLPARTPPLSLVLLPK